MSALPALMTMLFVVLVIFFLRFLLGKGRESFPFKKKQYLLSKAENQFFRVLLNTVGDENHVFVKVRLEDIFLIPKNTANRGSLRNRVKSRHLDFLLCSFGTVTPLLGIELDDSSHNTEKGREIDALKDQIFQNAGLPLLRVPVRANYNQTELKELIQNRINPPALSSESGKRSK